MTTLPASIVELLPHINASLNGLATALLISGRIMIGRGHEVAHKRTMISCFLVSTLFLASYLIYHGSTGHRSFPATAPAAVRTFYLTMLASHIVLAAAVPFLAIATITLGLLDRRAAHRRLARWTFPIWLYVSLTGVLVYVMLYHLYPALPS